MDDSAIIYRAERIIIKLEARRNDANYKYREEDDAIIDNLQETIDTLTNDPEDLG